MTSALKYANVRRYNLHDSRYLQKVKISLIVAVSFCLYFSGEAYWPLQVVFLSSLLVILFSLHNSIFCQFQPGSVLEIRSNPDRMICYDRAAEKSFAASCVEVRMTRWFILLKLGSSPTRQTRLLLRDSFDDMDYYTSFRRELIKSFTAKQ